MGIINECNGEYYVICICEGTAEQEILEWLLDEDKLLFKREDLIGKKTERSRTSKKIEDSYLSLDYDKPVYIIRIIDSKNEKFELGKLYKDRYKVFNLITNPEIEMLMIIHNGDYSDYTNKHADKKPSTYASIEYKIRNIKQSGTIKNFFNNDIDSLIEAIREHKRCKGKGHYTIADLLK